MPAMKDLTGQRFGRLTVIQPNGKDSQGHYKWLCACDCGNLKTIVGTYLTRGETQSCGCLHTEVVKAHNRSAAKIESTARWNRVYKHKHGNAGSRLYRVWGGMKKRCYNPNDSAYQYYGARGISICDDWLNDFSQFREWAMANGYDETAKHGECTIDRIDVDGNYEPGNCRWVSIAEQNRNRRKKVKDRAEPN